MALETLKNVEDVNGVQIYRFVDGHAKDTYDGTDYIIIDEDRNSVAFKIQKGPIKEFGVNGCQVDTIIETAKLILEGLNKNFPCRENSLAITKLEESLMWLNKRTENRIKAGVEGYSRNETQDTKTLLKD